MAKAQGVGRLLAGDGGDELFGGNTRYAKQKVFDAYYRIPSSLRQHFIEPAFSVDSPLRNIPLLSKAASYVRQARVPMPDRTEAYNLLQRFGASAVLTRQALAAIDEEAPLALQRRVFNDCDAADLVNRMLAYDWRFTLADTDLPKITGTASLAGIDIGFPLIDDELVDFSLALPAEMKVRGLRLRWFFKTALADFLPVEILRKKKHGFGLPFGPWVATNAPLRRFARLALGRLAARNLVRIEFVDELFSTHLSAHPGYYGEMIWILMILEHWLGAKAPDFSVPDN